MGWLDDILGRRERREPEPGPRAPPSSRPRVLMDLEHRDGLFHLVLKNHGDAPALDVETEFDRPLGVQRGERDLSELPVFAGTPYMVPGKTVEVFLGTAADLLPPEGDAREIRATVTYRGPAGTGFSDSATHDPETYRELGSVEP